MGVIRVQKNSNYVVMNKTALHDPRLSWKAKGLHAYMLSMPDDWKFYDDELEKHAKDGKDALKSAIKELKQYGYMRRERRQNEQGKFEWETIVYEEPYTEKPSMEKPSMEKPSMEKPSMENPQLLNNNNTNYKNTNYKNTNNDDDDKDRPKENDLNAFRFYEENFQPTLSSVDIEILNYWLDRFPEEIVLCAMRKALEQNVRRIKYIDRILANWEIQKVQTLEDVARLDRQYELEKQTKQKRGGVANGPIHKHRRSDGQSPKENERISHYEPGKWDDVDLSLEGLL